MEDKDLHNSTRFSSLWSNSSICYVKTTVKIKKKNVLPCLEIRNVWYQLNLGEWCNEVQRYNNKIERPKLGVVVLNFDHSNHWALNGTFTLFEGITCRMNFDRKSVTGKISVFTSSDNWLVDFNEMVRAVSQCKLCSEVIHMLTRPGL